MDMKAGTALVLSALSVLSAIVACGGGSPPPQSPEGTNALPGASPPPTVPPAQDAGPTTTTTLTLGDGGNLSGSKLTASGSQTIDVTIDGGPKSHTPDLGRSTKDIQAIVVARRDDARACYDNALKAHPGIEGNLDIKWTIDPKGNVTDISVDTSRSDIVEPSVGNCVIAIIKKIHFNESAKGFETYTHYPFNFHPRSGGVMVIGDAGSH
jgi:hypothetical protein